MKGGAQEAVQLERELLRITASPLRARHSPHQKYQKIVLFDGPICNERDVLRCDKSICELRTRPDKYAMQVMR